MLSRRYLWICALLLVFVVSGAGAAGPYIVDGSAPAPVVGTDFYGNTAKNSTHQTVILAITAATAVDDTVFVRDGTYTDETIISNSFKNASVVLAGESQAGTILLENTATYVLEAPFNRASIKIENLTLQSTAGVRGIKFGRMISSGTVAPVFTNVTVTGTASAIYWGGSAGVVDGTEFQGCTFEDMQGGTAGYHVYLNGFADNWIINNCVFDFESATLAGDDFEFVATNSLTFTNNTVRGSAGASGRLMQFLGVGSGVTAHPASNTIEFNTFVVQDNKNSIFFGSVTADDCSDSTSFSYNEVSGANDPANTQYLVEFEVPNAAGAALCWSEYNTVQNNIFDGGDVGVVFAEGTLWSVILGNKISSASDQGILIQDSRHIKIESNWVKYTPIGFEVDSGGNLTSNSKYVNVSDNIFQNCTDGIFVDGGTVQDSTFTYNKNIFASTTNVADVSGVKKTLTTWQAYTPSGMTWPTTALHSQLYIGQDTDSWLRKSGSIPYNLHRRFGRR